MFGEAESESPRVISPWNSLISVLPDADTARHPQQSNAPSSLPLSTLPSLVPEADDGNVEYKLQLLSPSPPRFARLVTQLKWRLLEGGGQAYYELGVADSGRLIGLPRVDLEHSLETLEMMAGEIGASVIVVKEIAIPAAMVDLTAAQEGSGAWTNKRTHKKVSGGWSSGSLGAVEHDPDSGSAGAEEAPDVAVLDGSPAASDPCTSYPIEPEKNSSIGRDEDAPTIARALTWVDLEISSVFKPRPMRPRVDHLGAFARQGKNKNMKRRKHINPFLTHISPAITAVPLCTPAPSNGAMPSHGMPAPTRASSSECDEQRARQHEKRNALVRVDTVEPVEVEETAMDESIIAPVPVPNLQLPSDLDEPQGGRTEDVDDVFASPAKAAFPSFPSTSVGESHLDGLQVGTAVSCVSGEDGDGVRLIVEALVVRKMLHEEVFLDFGGLSL